VTQYAFGLCGVFLVQIAVVQSDKSELNQFSVINLS
jgi:hypothetical protein